MQNVPPDSAEPLSRALASARTALAQIDDERQDAPPADGLTALPGRAG